MTGSIREQPGDGPAIRHLHPSKKGRLFFKRKSRAASTKSFTASANNTHPRKDDNPYQVEEQQHQQLGLEANTGIEGSYKPFAWQRLCHEGCAEDKADHNNQPGTTVKSLRELAALKLAEMIKEYPDDLTESIMTQSALTWDNGWKNVWDEVACVGSDSYSIFQRFANVFGADRRFRCHGKATYTRIFENSSRNPVHWDARTRCLNDRLMIRTNHRIEYIPGLRNMNSLVSELNERQHFKFLTLLDISVPKAQLMQPERQVFLDIMALPSLVALDVSGCESVDSTVLRCWAVSMKSGQWQNLRLLCLNRCSTITSSAVIMLMKTSSQSLSQISGLVYIETSENIENSLSQVEGWSDRSTLAKSTKNRKPAFPRKSFQASYGLGKKFIFLRNWFKQTSASGDVPLIVDPEGSANYMRNKYLLQEFVVQRGDYGIASDFGNEYFRVAWPTVAAEPRGVNKRSSSQVTNRSGAPRQKIVRRGIDWG